MKKVLKLVVIVAVISLAAIYGGCSIKNKVAFYPDVQYDMHDSLMTDSISRVHITTSDNETLECILFKHPDSIKRPAILYFHGNAGNVFHRYSYGLLLYQKGYNVLMAEYRGYGNSTGKTTEKGIYRDAEAANLFLMEELGYEQDQINLIGRSLGTAVAVNLAQNKPFRTVTLVTPMTSGKDMAKQFGFGAVKFLAGKSFSSIRKINHLVSPLCIVHGTEDEVISYQQGVDLYEAYNGEKIMITIEDGKHNDLHRVNPVKYWGGIHYFIMMHNTKN
jgi:fermentation-respiration switch protein FrsA (DUF1100 family)